MRVGLYTARPLGWQIANLVANDRDSELVGTHHDATGWWGTVGQGLREDVFAGNPDVVISVLGRHIFTPAEIQQATIVNLHLAPLPNYRGCNSIAHALLNGDREYGVTLHYVDEGIDTGPIIDIARFTIPPLCTGMRLYELATKAGWDLFAANWPRILGPVTATPQEGEGRYYDRHSLEPYMRLADWPEDQHDTIRRALHFPPFPAPQ